MLSARYAALALEIEVVGLEVAVAEAVEVRGANLERQVGDLGVAPLQRVDAAVDAALAATRADLAAAPTGGALIPVLRDRADELGRLIAEGRRLNARLRDQLSAESCVAPLRDALLVASQSLTDWYTVPAARIEASEWTVTVAAATTDIPLRELATAFIETTVATDLVNVAREQADALVAPAAALEDLERVVAFNIDLAAAELDLFLDVPVPSDTLALVEEMVIGAVGRSQARLQPLTREASSWPSALRGRVESVMLQELRSLRDSVLSGEIGELRRRLLRDAAVSRKLLRRAEQWSGSRVGGRIWTQFARVMGSERIERFQELAGLAAPVDAARPAASAFAPAALSVELPVVYRRLFSDQVLGSGELLVGRRDEVARAQRILAPGRGLRTVAVVGDRGTGKATLVSTITRGLDRGPVTAITLTAPATVDEVAGWFDGPDERVVVISGLEWLFSLRPGGAVPLERFVAGLVADGSRSSWLLAVDTGVWQAASALSALDAAVTEVIRLAPMDVQDLQDAVMTRHTMSGYGLSFEIDEQLGLRWSQIFGGQDKAREARKAAWFARLHRASGGVMADALRLWMASVTEVDEASGRISVGPVPSPPLVALDALPDDALLTLRQTVHQGWVSAAVHAEAFAWEPGASGAALAGLESLGLLTRDGERYRIAEHLRTAVVTVLRRRGWLP